MCCNLYSSILPLAVALGIPNPRQMVLNIKGDYTQIKGDEEL
jgi:hypothetical protein